MAGWLTNGVPNVVTTTGTEQASFDTGLSEGQNPQTASVTLQQLATFAAYYNSHSSKTMVAGSRYYSSFNIGSPTLLTGIGVLVGGTGGTDKWIAELHDSAGNLVATSDTSGTTAGTANLWQDLAFTAQYQAAAGTYFLTIQSNGTTATLATYAAPTSPLLTGSAAGTFGTGAAITPPATYTAAVGPVALPY